MNRAYLIVSDSEKTHPAEWLVTDAQVRGAIELYKARWPMNDYARTIERPNVLAWMERKSYKYAIRFEGRCYPPKQIVRLALALGQEPTPGYRFNGGNDRPGRTNTVLRELGFEVIRKTDCL